MPASLRSRSASLAYFGFFRQGCVCPVGALQNVAMALGQHQYALPLVVGIFFLLPLLFALFFGRVFCAAVCPLGAIQSVVLLKPKRVPALAGVSAGAAALSAIWAPPCSSPPPAAIFSSVVSIPSSPSSALTAAGLLIFGSAILVLGTVVARPYCRFLCPYGALLRLLSPLAKWRVSTTPDQCIQCRLCEEACPFGAIRKPVSANETLGTIAGNWRCCSGCCRCCCSSAVGWVHKAAAYWRGWMRRCGWPISSGWKITANRRCPRALHSRRSSACSRAKSDLKNASNVFRNSGQSAEQLFREAAAIRAQYRTGSTLFGVWLGWSSASA